MKKILISGAGIAGPSLAYWLERYGFEPTLVERAPHLRTGGYIVDFWGAGYDVADRMGLLPRLLPKAYAVDEVREVDRSGRRVSSVAVETFGRVTGGRFTSLPRGELAASIHEALADRVETIFDDSIAAIEDLGGNVRVEFERTPPRDFDLVVGADGLHSQVRRLVFGEEDRFERYLGLKVAAFVKTAYRPRDELVYVTHTEVGRQVARFAMRDDRTMFLFVFADETPDLPRDAPGERALLREKFDGSGWECPQILAALEEATGIYIDRVSQIRMERWAKGRVALVGDAAFCPSLLAGQGSALAMVAAYVLAGELRRANGDHEVAFAAYDQRLRRFIERKQNGAVRFAPFFAPSSRLGLFARTQIVKLMASPFITELAVGRELRDAIDLPEY